MSIRLDAASPLQIKLGWFCNFGLRLLLLLALFEPYPWASAVLVDELDADWACSTSDIHCRLLPSQVSMKKVKNLTYCNLATKLGRPGLILFEHLGSTPPARPLREINAGEGLSVVVRCERA